MVTFYFIESFVEAEDRFCELGDVVGEFGLADAVPVAQPTTLSRAVAVSSLVVSHVLIQTRRRTSVVSLRVAHRCFACRIKPHSHYAFVHVHGGSVIRASD